MNIREYIESGILELFAMNLLGEAERAEVVCHLEVHAELAHELKRIEEALENYAQQNSITPSSHLKTKVLATITNLKKEAELDLADLPLINKYSDHKKWLKFVDGLGEQPIGEDGRYIRMLRRDDEVTQLLIVSTTSIEEEIHEAEHESFLILSGACRCTVGDQVTLMSAGDFMSIPLLELHDVQLLSPKVTAILQHVRA